ncbi:MAG: TonB-dependent receptor, partial [Gemmatimonadetes bacterium]|nr:TonB-dependent receptor [Gemmatimonadota bacterium]
MTLRSRRRARLVGALAVVAISVAPPAASAQDPPPEPDSVVTLRPLVVTARNREELLQNVPLSVTALSGRDLEFGQIGTTDRLGQMMPNVNFNHS